MNGQSRRVTRAKGPRWTQASDADVRHSSLRDLRFLIWPIYIPAFAAVVAQSFVISVLPIYLKDDLRAGPAAVGAVVSMQGLGSVSAATFMGILIDAFGERAGMLFGAALRIAGYLGCAMPPLVSSRDAALIVVSSGRYLTGVGMSCFQVSRNAFMKDSVPSNLRGRANSLIGGAARMANIVGPALGGMVVSQWGATATFLVQALLGCGVLALLVCVLPSSRRPGESGERGAALGESGIVVGGGNDSSATAASATSFATGETVACTSSSHAMQGDDLGMAAGSIPILSRRLCAPWLLTLATFAPIGMSFSFVRAVRNLLIPLKADALRLSPAEVGCVTASSFAFDALFFPAAGWLMDGYGRKVAGVPSLLLMGLGLALLGSACGVLTLVAGSMLLGIGNGLSSGLVMTIGQDAAPYRAKGKFLGMWKACTDSATFFGPMAVGAIAQTSSLDDCCYLMGALACAFAVYYALLGREVSRSDTGCRAARTWPPMGSMVSHGGADVRGARLRGVDHGRHAKLVEELDPVLPPDEEVEDPSSSCESSNPVADLRTPVPNSGHSQD